MLPTRPGAPLGIHSILFDDSSVMLRAEGSAESAPCPSCCTLSHQVHDRYQRRPLDLPWRGYPVFLVITVRRFRCPNQGCPRATFAEDFGPRLPRRARRTTDADGLLLLIAHTAGGEAGARLAKEAGLPTSPDTLLRLLRRKTGQDLPTPRVLGVDDLSLRRRHSYATILVNLETHRPVDLLAGREAEVLANWLRDHPGVEIIVRDRSEAYAEGGRVGAPQAQQVADRFHLLQNAGAALDEMLRARRRSIEFSSTEPDTDQARPDGQRPLSATRQRRAERRAERIARWERVRTLRDAGTSIRGIAREMGIHRRTVRGLLSTPEPPRNRRLHPRPGGLNSPTLQPYVGYLQDRWEAGCHNVSRLYRELVLQGYTGSRSLLAQSVQPWRPPRPPPGKRRRSRRSVRWLCLRPADELSAEERAALGQVLEADTELATGYDLLRRFRSLVTSGDVAALGPWLADARGSNLPGFVGMANGITADLEAVDAALTTRWSNGATEGHVHRVKLIKRQGYGRAKLDLLRRRVLAA